MVFTVEPGLYFNRAAGKAPACGVRIEDDVLVTQNGTEVLSKQIPKEIAEVESLVG
jgi:Xaa-Pro aminopeptidase